MIVGRMSPVGIQIRSSPKRINRTYDTAFRVLMRASVGATSGDEARVDGTSSCASSNFAVTCLGVSVAVDATKSRFITGSFSTRPVTTSSSMEVSFSSPTTGSVWVERSNSDTADSAAPGSVTTSSSSRSATISLIRDTSSVSSAPDSGGMSEKISLS